jgi:hypothetical protein
VKSKYTKNSNIARTNSREKIMEIEKNAIIRNKRNKILFTLSTLLLCLLVILIVKNLDKKIVIDEYSNITELDPNKYQAEILSLYNREGQLEAFLKEMDRVQSLVGRYLISNSTLKEDSFSNLVKTLNNEINREIWVELDSEKSTYYLGKYSIDENGYVKFRFETKEIQPNWINDERVQKYIILN